MARLAMTAGRRRIYLVAATLVALMVLAVVIAVALFDINQYKEQIAEAVRTNTSRTLKLKGDLGLSIFPSLAITLPASSLSAKRSEAEFVSFASARVTIALLPLLRRKIVVDSLDVQDAQATLIRRRDGRITDDADLDVGAPLVAAPAPAAAPGSAAAAPSPDAPEQAAPATTAAWEVAELRLSDATISLRDEASGQTTTLSAITMKTGRLAPKTNMPLELNARLSASAAALAGDIALTASVDLDLAAAAFAASDVKFGFAGTHHRQPLRASLSASRWSLVGDASSATEVVVQAAGQRAADAWSVTANAAQMAIEGVSGAAASLHAENLVLTASQRVGPATRQAWLSGPLSASLESRTLAMPQFDGEVSIDDPRLPDGRATATLSGAMQLDGRSERLDLKLAASAADTRLNAAITVKNFGQPEIAFEIDADRLNVDPYLLRAGQVETGLATATGAATEATRAAATAAGSGSGSGSGSDSGSDSGSGLGSKASSGAGDRIVDWTPWRDLRLHGKLQIGQLQVRGIKATAVRASVRSAAGRTTVLPLSARLYGGQASAELALDAAGQRASLKLSLQHVDIGALARDALHRGDLSGRGDVDLALSTAGQSKAEMTRAAQGSGRFALRDFALVGVDLPAVLGQLTRGLTGSGTPTGQFDGSKRTVLSRLSGTVKLADGVVRNDDLDGAAPQLGLQGRGQFDLRSKQLDYTLRVTVTANPIERSKLLTALAGISVPVHFSGPSDDLRYSINLTDVATDAIARRGLGVGAAVIEEAEGFLGGLLGRGKKKK